METRMETMETRMETRVAAIEALLERLCGTLGQVISRVYIRAGECLTSKHSEAYGSHPVFQEDVSTLQIQLYYDEIDVCNAIGSRSTVHKLDKKGAFSHGCYMVHVSFIIA